MKVLIRKTVCISVVDKAGQSRDEIKDKRRVYEWDATINTGLGMRENGIWGVNEIRNGAIGILPLKEDSW